MKALKFTWTWTWLILLICPAQAQQPLLSSREKTEIIQQEWKRQNKLLAAPVLSPSSVQTGARVIEQEEKWPAQFSQSVTLKAVDLPLSVILRPIGQATHHNIILGPGVEDKKFSINPLLYTHLRSQTQIMFRYPLLRISRNSCVKMLKP